MMRSDGKRRMSKPQPDKVLSLALAIRQAALFLAKVIEDWALAHYGYNVGKRTDYERG